MRIFLFFLLLILSSFVCIGQIPTFEYKSKSTPVVNWIDSYSYGKTCYQIDRSIGIHNMYTSEGYYVNAYHYYIWFFNQSKIKINGQWTPTSTYIQEIKVYIDNVYIGKYWLLINADHYFINVWSKNPKAVIRVEFTKPLPY